MALSNPTTTKAIHPAWVALAVTFFVLLSAAAVRAPRGVLFLRLEQEFHWSRSTVSLAVSVNILLYGLVGPFAGALEPPRDHGHLRSRGDHRVRLALGPMGQPPAAGVVLRAARAVAP